ncbi:hypothetical protein L6164_002659 [Bauhinia variegata]|uniref:Uncharacterized protein n=1 Tax=Bauhinia variegata TaxID=167791 RepID=A0ACB9PZ00_BAUVA|nr:hypothetical protein L6164_002659 [Bauhinia variegata]
MKTIFLAFFVLFAFSTTVPTTTGDFVYDTDNQPLINSGSYHIIPAIKLKGWGGGLELGGTGNEICPHSVVQARSDIIHGLPAKLSSPFKILYIDEGWTVKQAKVERLEGPFKIDKVLQLGYKLVYCPSRGEVCGDLGIHHDRRLVMNDERPFIVNFKKGIVSSPDWNIV